MAEYLVKAGDSAIEPYVTSPDQVDSIRFVDNVGRAQLISDGGAEIRVTINGTEPAFLSAGSSSPSFRLPAGTPSVIDFPMTGSPDVVKVRSKGEATISVQVLI